MRAGLGVPRRLGSILGHDPLNVRLTHFDQNIVNEDICDFTRTGTEEFGFCSDSGPGWFKSPGLDLAVCESGPSPSESPGWFQLPRYFLPSFF